MGSCYKCIRYLMFGFNVIFWLLGCALLGVGIWITVDKNFSKYVNNSSHFDHILYTGAFIFIAVGCLIMIVGFLGCCGALRENQIMLGLFFAFLFIIFATLLGAGIWAFKTRDAMPYLVEDFVKKTLEDGVKGYFDEKSSTRDFMDMIQDDFECCGATRGAMDYDPTEVAKVEACTRFVRPCNIPLSEFLITKTKTNLVIIAGVAIGIAVMLILGMIFSLILCCALRDPQMD